MGVTFLMVVKRRMADSNPTHVKCVLPAHRAAALKLSFQQPSGISARRPIGDSVKKNIKAYAPRCKEQGILSSDGLLFCSRGPKASGP